jgi:hypothetical protein
MPPPHTPHRNKRPNIGKFHDVAETLALQKIVVHGTNQPFRNAVPHSTIRNKLNNPLFFNDIFYFNDLTTSAFPATRKRRLFYMSWRSEQLD